MRMGSRVLLRAALAAATVACAALVPMRAEYAIGTPGWYAGDLHTHTYLTDGKYAPDTVADRALGTFRLGFFANSEHGGWYARDADGVLHASKQPRWRTLISWSYPTVESIRSSYPDRIVIQGLEWNVPTHDHASVGIVADEPQAISDFEYLYDAGDTDTSRSGIVKHNKTHADALLGVRWLAATYPVTSYLVVNHPSRKLEYSASDLRELQDAAPGVVVGFEGMPGHQRRADRGGYHFDYGTRTYLARTYGGADYALAKVGGTWDSLLAEGRQLHVFANSDFHRLTYDFWPGEYSKTWAWLDDPTDPTALLRAMRSGRIFVAHGDLIDGLVFSAARGVRRTEMGRRALVISRGEDITVTVRFHTPRTGAAGNHPRVHHIDLIASPLKPRAQPETAGYRASTNTGARVVSRLYRSELTSLGDGWYEGRVKLKDVESDSYLRLRGTNLAPGTRYETSAAGNPLSDRKRGTNSTAKALADLWFYSNPIWIDVR